MREGRGRRWSASRVAALALGLVLSGSASALAAGPATEFPAGAGTTDEAGIAAGPDGNLWYTEDSGNRIGRITPAGHVDEFSTGITANSKPRAIAAGPDGDLWFTEWNRNHIGRITPAGHVDEFTTGSGTVPEGIAAGPDGNLWFTEALGNRIGRMTPAGHVDLFPAGSAANSFPAQIAAGTDGNVWFTEQNADLVGRITPAGHVDEFGTGIGAASEPEGIATGPDGNVWFTEYRGDRIGRITPAGHIDMFSTGITPVSGPIAIVSGPDGNLWFTERDGSRIGRITPTGQVDEFSSGITPGSKPDGITAGPDGNLWFIELSGSIGRIATDVPAPASGNLLRNPGFDLGTPGPSRLVTAPAPGWVTVPNFTEGLYGGTNLPGTALADQIGGGRGFGWGGANTPDKSQALQLVDLARESVAIDDGRATVDLAGLLGGENGQNDNARVEALFLSGSGAQLTSLQIGPVTSAERGPQTTLLPRSASAAVPAGTRAIRVVATATNLGGGSDNGYFDNLSLTLDVTPLPPAGPAGGGTPGGGGVPVPDTTAPLFLAARLVNATFAVDTKGAAETAVTAARAKKGTTFVYTLSEASTVLFTIEQKQKGRKVGAKCVKTSKKNRRRRACTRYAKVGTFAQSGAAGPNSKKFSGKIGKRKLKAGNYRATLSAKDAAGNVSPVKRLNFKVVRR